MCGFGAGNGRLPPPPRQNRMGLTQLVLLSNLASNLAAAADGTLVRYQILAYPADGGEPIPADDGATFSYLVGDPAQPEWAREAIVYQVFPDRFYPGNGRAWNQTNDLNDIYGGTLRGIIEKLDYIADLGFNAIWLNPFFPDDTHHGYHATDYFAVNPRLGTLDDIRELVAAAHERGIRLLLDFVANHWSSEHATFRAAQADRNSEYHDWYTWYDWPHEYKTFFGVKELPQINLEHRPAREHMLKAARYWLAELVLMACASIMCLAHPTIFGRNCGRRSKPSAPTSGCLARRWTRPMLS